MTNVIDTYHLTSGQWTAGTLPAPLRGLVNAAVFGTEAVFTSEFTDEASAAIYDASSDTWSTTALPAATTPADFGRLTTVGPYALRMDDTATVQTFDSRTGQWTSAELPASPHGARVVTVGDDAVIFGQTLPTTAGTVTRPVAAVDVFDDRTGQWSTAQLSQARLNVTAARAGHTLLFAGGQYVSRSGRSYASRVVDVFDADTGRWSTATLPPDEEPSDVLATELNGKAIFADAATGHAVAYDPATGTWSVIRLASGQIMPQALVTVGNRAFVLGRTESIVPTPLMADVLTTADPSAGGAAGSPRPADGAVVAAVPFTFRWSPAAGATSYDVYVDNLPFARGVTATRFGTTRVLGVGGHTWQVVAQMPDGAVWSFTTRGPQVTAVASGVAAGEMVTPSDRPTLTATVRNDGTGELAAPYRVDVYGSSSRLAGGRVLLGSTEVTGEALAANGGSAAVDVPLSFTGFAGIQRATPLTLLLIVSEVVAGRHVGTFHDLITARGPLVTVSPPAPPTPPPPTPTGASTAGGHVR